MKTLVVYYSLEGNTEIVAKEIQSQLNSDIIQLQPKEEIDKTKFSRYFWGGKSVFFKEKSELLNNFPDFGEYDKIFIGSPIWSSNLPPTFYSFLSHIKNKEVYVFATHKGSGEKRFLDFIKKYEVGIISSKIFKETLNRDISIVKKEVEEWITSLQI